MRTFQANEELEKILLLQGFIETTTETNKLKGKKSFKLHRQSHKEIHFNFTNIEIISKYVVLDSRTVLNENELKLVLLFCKLNHPEVNEFMRGIGKFNIEYAQERFLDIKREFEELKAFDLYGTRLNKLNRILKAYMALDLSEK